MNGCLMNVNKKKKRHLKGTGNNRREARQINTNTYQALGRAGPTRETPNDTPVTGVK